MYGKYTSPIDPMRHMDSFCGVCWRVLELVWCQLVCPGPCLFFCWEKKTVEENNSPVWSMGSWYINMLNKKWFSNWVSVFFFLSVSGSGVVHPLSKEMSSCKPELLRKLMPECATGIDWEVWGRPGHFFLGGKGGGTKPAFQTNAHTSYLISGCCNYFFVGSRCFIIHFQIPDTQCMVYLSPFGWFFL